jgi:chaperonin GroEL
MGPRGQNVVIERPGDYPVLTKDGVTVAKSVNLSDRFANLGAQMIKEAASRTSESAGDGTTTATVLTQAIFVEGIKMLAAGHPIDELRAGIEMGVDIIIGSLAAQSSKVKNDQEIVQVGTISANGEEKIGTLLAEAMSLVGRDGVITVEEAKGFETTLNVVDGVRLERGYLSPYFINDKQKSIVELDEPYVLVTNRKIKSMQEILPILEEVHQSQKGLLIIADEIEGEAMQALVVNALRGTLRVCAIRAPGIGEYRYAFLDDLATLLGTKILTQGDDDLLKSLTLNDLGSCKKATITRTHTTLVECVGHDNEISARLDEIKRKLNLPTLNDRDKDVLTSRLSKLSKGVAVLRVGGATELELRERKDRVDDALNATQAAVEEGIVPGGGVALVRAAQSITLEDFDESLRIGMDIIRRASSAPLSQIVRNSGGSPEVVIDKVINAEYNIGYDARRGEMSDMFSAGIIDPVKVVRCAIQNAGSSAAMMLTVGCVMIEEDTA